MNLMQTTVDDPAANLLLAALPRQVLARLLRHLEPVDLRVGEVLHELGRRPQWAYFPVNAVVSLLMPMQDGRSDEVCAVGREGMCGLALLMDGGASTDRAVVQCAGRAFRVRSARLREEVAHSASAMSLLLRYTTARSAELAQSIMCSRHHTTAQRLCRRLLEAMDRQEQGDLRLTQEQLAGLLGVRRESVATEARKLQQAGAISYSRGRLKVLDRACLLRHSCECYCQVNGVYEQLAGDPANDRGSGLPSAVDLTAYLQQVREKERGDLARELHDELGSLLTRAKLDLAGLQLRLGGGSEDVDQRMMHLGEMINRGIAFSRHVVEGLHPASLANLGLAASIANLARDFEKGAGISTQLDLDEVEADDETRLAIYRVVQEALNNITKYAAAREVGVTMHRRGSDIIVLIRDDGRGFDTDAAGPASHGLASMNHRVQACAGKFTITSSPGAGTVVMAVLPLRPGVGPRAGARPPAMRGPHAARPVGIQSSAGDDAFASARRGPHVMATKESTCHQE